MEYDVDALILFWQVNMICNPRNNANDGKNVQPNVERACKIASMPMGSA